MDYRPLRDQHCSERMQTSTGRSHEVPLSQHGYCNGRRRQKESNLVVFKCCGGADIGLFNRSGIRGGRGLTLPASALTPLEMSPRPLASALGRTGTSSPTSVCTATPMFTSANSLMYSPRHDAFTCGTFFRACTSHQ